MTATRIESVDFFYLAMPEATVAADGSQDALVVRVRAGDHEGWGECEAAPLPSIAAFVCPMSHGACRPVSDAVMGAKVETPDDIRAIAARVSRLAQDMTRARITPDADGLIHIPAAPGLGVEVNTDALETYHVEVGIRVSGQTVFQPPSP